MAIAGQATYRTAHVRQRLFGPLHAAALRAHCERSRDVAAELHGNATALEKSALVTTALLWLKILRRQALLSQDLACRAPQKP